MKDTMSDMTRRPSDEDAITLRGLMNRVSNGLADQDYLRISDLGQPGGMLVDLAFVHVPEQGRVYVGLLDGPVSFEVNGDCPSKLFNWMPTPVSESAMQNLLTDACTRVDRIGRVIDSCK